MKGKGMKMGKMHRAKGGRVRVDEMEAGEGGGDPYVEEEAEEKKHGGRAKKKRGGKVEGKEMKHRADRPRPGRKSGGRVGSDKSPLSSAHNTESGPGPTPKTEEGGLSK